MKTVFSYMVHVFFLKKSVVSAFVHYYYFLVSNFKLTWAIYMTLRFVSGDETLPNQPVRQYARPSRKKQGKRKQLCHYTPKARFTNSLRQRKPSY